MWRTSSREEQKEDKLLLMGASERKMEKKSETNETCYSGFDGTLSQYSVQSSDWAGPAIKTFDTIRR
jgi:hypothetical protein